MISDVEFGVVNVHNASNCVVDKARVTSFISDALSVSCVASIVSQGLIQLGLKMS